MNQNNNQLPDWLRAVVRNAAFRKGLILDGHVRDIFYDPQQRDYVDLPTLLLRHLAPQGFTIAAQWDPVENLRFADSRMLVRWQEAMRQGEGRQVQTEGRAYDAGEAVARQPEAAASLPIGAGELFPGIRKVLSAPSERPLFVLSWSQYFLSEPAHLGTDERECMLHLGKALRGQPIVPMDSDHLRRTDGLVILLTTTLAKIDPLFYQQEPRVTLITVPPPARTERRAFFLRHMDDLRCERPRTSSVSATDTREALADTLADLTDQSARVDLQQILSLSLQTDNPLPPERLMNLYRFGEQRSPWEELGEEKIRHAEETLRRRVVGQDAAVRQVATMIIRAYMGLAGLHHSSRRSKPKGILFFCGPTGVGKTELAKALAEFLFGDEAACIRFDMSEYNHEHSDQRLVGAPPGYVGFEEGGQLTNAIRERPFSIVLLDEIEKAHGRILDKGLQIFDDGRLTDGRGETAYFSEAVIILTSNIGASDMPDSTDPVVIRNHFVSAVERHFVHQLGRPELLNRLGDNIVVFNPITDAGFRRAIVERKIQPLRAYLQDRFGVGLSIAEALADHYVRCARSEHGGRGVVNALERDLLNPLARFLFDHTHQLRRGRVIHADLVAGQVTFDLQEG
ncbi:MAG: ATP-dependent Clp protease ATP-binding subunit [Sedimentisphaerales bacterium]|nr:ATP-dependent Clp protease ATP-binding subunit [Sedimentisphaerales bacterium]